MYPAKLFFLIVCSCIILKTKTAPKSQQSLSSPLRAARVLRMRTRAARGEEVRKAEEKEEGRAETACASETSERDGGNGVLQLRVSLETHKVGGKVREMRQPQLSDEGAGGLSS